MPNLSSLLQSAEHPGCCARKGFVEHVMHAVHQAQERQVQRSIVLTTVLLIAAVVVFFGSMGTALEGLESGEASGILTILWQDPNMLFVQETWMAAKSLFPLLWVLLSLIASLGCIVLLYRFIRPLFSPRLHAVV
jgi:hypothetical protein